MGGYCIVMGCKSHGKGVKLFNVPKVSELPSQTATTRRRRTAWLKNINRANIPLDTTRTLHVCYKHFISGQPAKTYDELNPDWAPTQNMGYRTTFKVNQKSLDRLHRARNRQTIQKPETAGINFETVYLNDNAIEPTPQPQPPPPVVQRSDYIPSSVGTAMSNVVNNVKINNVKYIVQDGRKGTIVAVKSMDNSAKGKKVEIATQTELRKENFDLFDSNSQFMQNEIVNLKKQLVDTSISLEFFKGNHKMTYFYTGIPKYEMMRDLFLDIRDHIPRPKDDNLTKFKIFYLTLAHLRQPLSFTYFSHEFGVSIHTISRHFRNCLNVLYCSLKSLVYWPRKEAAAAAFTTIPFSFKITFGNRVSVIVHCTEIYMNKTPRLDASGQDCSSDKHNDTVKYLIGVTPHGFICFVSHGYAGNSTEKFILENCGILDLLQEGDIFIADRSFSFENAEGSGRGDTFPVFTKVQDQFYPLSIEKTSDVAKVGVHINRTLTSLRNKYTVLAQRITTTNLAVADQLVYVASALYNLGSPISDNRNNY